MKSKNVLTIDGTKTVRAMLAARQLYNLRGVAKATGYCVTYLRRLCHVRAVAHHRLLGRYYMTPAEVSALIKPVKPIK